MQDFLFKQFKVSTGIALCDSGGDSGRRWQQNADKTIQDFNSIPEVSIDEWDLKNAKDTSDIIPTVSTWHYMLNNLELDDLCDEFNAIPCKDWNSELAYGLSLAGEKYLINQGFNISRTWNSYNSDTNLDYILQGANLTAAGSSAYEFPEYLLIQIHLGADVRGGYTDAKLYRVINDYFDTNPVVSGTIGNKEVTTGYNGYNITDDSGEPVKINKNSKINLYV